MRGKCPHWFAVTRLTDNRLSGLIREVAEMIDEEDDGALLLDMSVSLKVLRDGARAKARNLSGHR